MTIDDIQRLIQSDETRTLELKKTTGKLKDGMRSACAFLNTAGGLLLFGVAPGTLQIVGQQVTENTRREIARELTKLEPSIDLPIEYLDVPDREGFQVIAICLDGAVFGDVPYTYDGKPYLRVESTTVVMPRDVFEERIMRSRLKHYPWESQICEDITVTDLDEQRIRGAVRLGVEHGRMPASSLTDTTERLVEELRLTKKGQLKNAAAALFLRDTSDFPQFLLRMARFRGTDKTEFIDNQRAYGNFFNLLDAGMAFFFKHLSISGKIVGFMREEKLEIPSVALREALTNALCHRQFHSPSGSVGIAIYDDRVEIENTGLLPEELTVETIKTNHQSFAQNPLIADILFKTTFLENWGSGVSRMFDACKEAGLPEPKYGTNGLFVWITFYRPTPQPHNLETEQPNNRTTEQLNKLETKQFQNPATSKPHNLKTPQPQNPTTSKPHNLKTSNKKAKQLKKLFSLIGEKGTNIKTLMDGMHLRDRKNFLTAYLNPCIAMGYIAMLYSEKPNHPMQSYYLTQKGREMLEKLMKEQE
ncbi:MAG: putative DNA binding domain-containing protein [Bacteroidales bacterium]|nr:putative DNA binding domain-containing protein [Bacteroidales bacterium]